VLNVSGPALVLGLVVDVAAAAIGFTLAEQDRRRLGRPPWGLPSAVWALLCFMLGLIGLIVFLFAHRAEVRRGPQGPAPTFDALGRYASAAAPAPPTGSDFPAYPRPADGTDRGAPAVPSPPPAPSRPQAAADPSWQPDPGGRFHYRWWTGTEWTSYVATHGRVVVDTSPDQRIGPY